MRRTLGTRAGQPAQRQPGAVAAAAAWSAIDAAGAPDGVTFWARRDERVGLLRVDAQGEHLVCEPQFVDVWNFEHGVATVSVDSEGKLGLVGPDGRWLMPPTFDEVSFEANGFARVEVDKRYGFIDRAGRWALEACWLDAGDFTAQGVAPVRSEAGWGLVRDGRHGLLDAAGQPIVPCEYDALEAFAPAHFGPGLTYHAAGIACTLRRDGAGRRYGLFDLVAGREIGPCRHSWPAMFGWGSQHGWLIAEEDPARPPTGDLRWMRMGVLRADGSTLFPRAYAWIATRMMGEDDFGMYLRHELHGHWHKGEPAQAVRSDDDATVWLHADGREQSHVDHARERRAAGDRAAAEEFAGRLRDGEGVPQDVGAAREWFGFAAGVPEQGDVADPSVAHAAGRVRAMCALSSMLRDGDGGPVDAVAARAWLRLALKRGGKDDGEVHALLAHLHGQGLGGAPDLERARHHYRIAVRNGSRMGFYNLGQMCLAGEGGPVDLDEAADCFRKSDAHGSPIGTYQLGVVLGKRAQAATDTVAAGALWKESGYFLRKAAEHDDARLRAWACRDLARLHLRGVLGPNGVREARPWLVLGADPAIGGDSDGHDEVRAECVALLADRIHGPVDSPLHDPVDAQRWRRTAAAVAAPAGPPELSEVLGLGAVSRLLGRLFGRKPRGRDDPSDPSA